MSSVSVVTVHNKVMDYISEITGITDPVAIESAASGFSVPTGGKIYQVIITNNSVFDIYLKLWDQGGAPASGGGANWNAEPQFILPCAGNEVADYTFLGASQYAFATGWQINVSDKSGSIRTSSATLDAEVILFTS